LEKRKKEKGKPPRYPITMRKFEIKSVAIVGAGAAGRLILCTGPKNIQIFTKSA
jgi:hypothetical protein